MARQNRSKYLRRKTDQTLFLFRCVHFKTSACLATLFSSTSSRLFPYSQHDSDSEETRWATQRVPTSIRPPPPPPAPSLPVSPRARLGPPRPRGRTRRRGRRRPPAPRTSPPIHRRRHPHPPPAKTPTGPAAGTSNGTDSPTLRPNRKSIDLPGLNTFAPPAPSSHASSRQRSRGSRVHIGGGGGGGGSRLVERGRTWLHGRNGSAANGHANGAYGGGIGGGRGRGGTPPPRSQAIAIPIPGRNGLNGKEEETETGYGNHAREGIARRKKEAAEAAEAQR
ncbi:hypothetical protein MVEN_00352500 [Mycena venus]|uniref:Uncharacterized protein n=1 Tax=Mycena venus TaxID=2733690 RepID=A0A8H7D775_9AGAR|nr:hypothetical protein MVEN_00352500 [Mycena venus]